MTRKRCIEVAAASIADQLAETEPEPVKKIRTAIEEHGLVHVLAVLAEIERVADKQTRGDALTRGEWWVMFRRDGQPRTVGGRFFATNDRRLAHRAPEPTPPASPTPTRPPSRPAPPTRSPPRPAAKRKRDNFAGVVVEHKPRRS